MATKEEQLRQRIEKQRIKQEQRELRGKMKEFNKMHYTYYTNELSVETKRSFSQEMNKLGAFKPFYSEDENERAIPFMKMWTSQDEEIKNIAFREAEKHFSINDRDKIITLLNDIYQDNLKFKEKMQKIREAIENKKYDMK